MAIVAKMEISMDAPTNPTDFPIRTDLPLLKRRWGRGRPKQYPWSTTPVGGSFFIPGGRISTHDARPGCTRLINLGHACKTVPGSRWAKRSVTEDGVNGVRVWRTA